MRFDVGESKEGSGMANEAVFFSNLFSEWDCTPSPASSRSPPSPCTSATRPPHNISKMVSKRWLEEPYDVWHWPSEPMRKSPTTKALEYGQVKITTRFSALIDVDDKGNPVDKENISEEEAIVDSENEGTDTNEDEVNMEASVEEASSTGVEVNVEASVE
ncbi:hypothetical protein IGI04_015397 [Brassica rapa subsp. trilocularis]|uniref:Uncharacterized protein n=1 Tax=Brassica rapa subsp. trilocularis TaxID=1813537 RepID=A0ABQ7MQG8_BRACM|nr:hypothetical protein IGI04_015397 [Brassica rapa subsp. trilocularis]